MTCHVLCERVFAAIVTYRRNCLNHPPIHVAYRICMRQAAIEVKFLSTWLESHYPYLMSPFELKIHAIQVPICSELPPDSCVFMYHAGRAAQFYVCAGLMLFSATANAALTARDQFTQALERRVADDPRSAIRESELWLQQGAAGADKSLTLRALRLMAMAQAQLEDSVTLAKVAARGLEVARQLGDAEAECEFLSAKAVALSEEGKYLEAQPVFDAAIGIAERAGLKRAATGAMVSKAFVYGLRGRNADGLELLLRAHQRYVELGDARIARTTLSAIGTAYAHDHASREELLKALDYHQQSLAPDAEQNSRHELATVNFNLAIVHERLKDLPMAESYARKSISLYAALDDPIGVAFGSYRLGRIAVDSAKWDEAVRYLDSALPELTKSGDATMIFNIQRARAKAFAHLDRRRESLDALERADAIRRNINSPALDANYLKEAAEVYAMFGDFARAYRSQLSLRNAERKSAEEARDKDAAETRTRFEVKQKEAENELLRARERESEARRVALVLAIVLLSSVLGGLGWYLFRQGQQNRRFANLAMRDDLTGLPNRRSIVRSAGDQLAAVRRANSHMCVGLIDIDHFKSINDECGHAVGDAVLAAFSDVCSQQLRSNDRLGRYGGEEFLLIMPGSDLAQAPQVFGRLRDAIQSISVAGLPAGRKLTISMGIVDAVGSTDGLDTLIKRADDALYRAKQGGRDRYEPG